MAVEELAWLSSWGLSCLRSVIWCLDFGAWFWDDDLWGLVKQTIRFLILYDILYQSSFRFTIRARNLICCLNMNPSDQQAFSRVN